MSHTIWRRALGVAAGTAALTLGVATTASAHHCYKVDWNAKAYEQQSTNKSPWMPLSGLGAMIIAEELGMPECSGYASVAIDHWMEETGTTTEPLIHMKATVGSGAAYQGKTVKPFNYLGEADFMILDKGLEMAIGQCMADQT